MGQIACHGLGEEAARHGVPWSTTPWSRTVSGDRETAERIADPTGSSRHPGRGPVVSSPKTSLALLLAVGVLVGLLGGCGGELPQASIEGRYTLDRHGTEKLLRQDLEAATTQREDIRRSLENLERLSRWEIVIEVGGALVTRPDGETFRGSWRRLEEGSHIELTFEGQTKVVELVDDGLLIDFGSSGARLRWSFIRVETP